MPTYEFVCRDCGSPTEVRASIEQKRAGLAPHCRTCGGADLRQLFQTVAVAASGPAPGCCGAGGCGCGH